MPTVNSESAVQSGECSRFPRPGAACYSADCRKWG
jgi:hypothetical protein